MVTVETETELESRTAPTVSGGVGTTASDVAHPEPVESSKRPRTFWKRMLWLLATVGVIAVAGYFYYISEIWKKETKVITHTISRSDLVVTVLEQGTLESSDNTEIKCQVRGQNTITFVVESGTIVNEGDELVRLDTLALEEAITERIKFAHLTKASAERLKATVRSSELAIDEYKEGQFKAELMGLEKDLAIAKSNLNSAENVLQHNKMKAERGFGNSLQIEELKISLMNYNQQVENLKTQIKVLKDFTLKEQLATLEGDLAASKANYDAEAERQIADENRRDRAIAELEHCVVTAPRSGLVIHPSAAQWEGAPDIEEGATVHKTQTMLLMPDLDKMQVNVGVHESVVDRIKPGLEVIVTLTDRELLGEVASVATITKPAGWWTGNVVKYDTIVKLPEKEKGLKPGMSAEVEIILARHENVVTVPVAAVLQSEKGDFCWVKSDSGIKRRILKLGDSNDVFIQVISGLDEGDEVVLNPLAYIDEAEAEALLPKSKDEKAESEEAGESPSKDDGKSKSKSLNSAKS